MMTGVEPRVPDDDSQDRNILDLGPQHASIRDDFLKELLGIVKLAEGTESVTIPSSSLLVLGKLALDLHSDHADIERKVKTDEKTKLVSSETARFEMNRTVSDRRRQCNTDPSLYEVPFASYAFFDIDNFHDINHIIDEPIADLTIADIGRSLNQSLKGYRRGDFASRFGGDEFGIWFSNLFGNEDDSDIESHQYHFTKLFEIARKLHEDVHTGLHDPNRGISKEQLERIGQITFSFGFTYPTLGDIDRTLLYRQLDESTVIEKRASEQEKIAKIDRSITTIATDGVVYDINGNRLN